jgi:hypothetical protein
VQSIERLLTIAELAAISGLTARRLRREVELHELSALRVGRRELRIEPAEARRYLRALGHCDSTISRANRAGLTFGPDSLLTLDEFAAALNLSSGHTRVLAHERGVPLHYGNGTRILIIHGRDAWAFVQRLDRVGYINPAISTR